MSRRPDNVDPEVWNKQRAIYWKRVNRVWNVLMLLAALALLARYFGWLPGFH
jgi:hypothetical protein